MSEREAQLDKIEKMLQVVLEAICSLAKEVTGNSMVIGSPDDAIGATSVTQSVKWIKKDD